MNIPTFTINLDKKCAECRKGGAADNGICVACTNRAMRGKPMKSEVGRAVQRRWQAHVRNQKLAVRR